MPVVITPPAARSAVSEFDCVIGERGLLSGDTENAGAGQHLREDRRGVPPVSLGVGMTPRGAGRMGAMTPSL